MSKQVRITVEATSAASPAAVYGLLADGASWPRWTPFDAFELEREGKAGGESTGAIRVFRSRRVTNREELTELSPDRLISYRSLSGMPVRNHAASVRLAATEDGTLITWDEQFEAVWPGTGWYLARALQKFVQDCADGLASHAVEVSPEARDEAARDGVLPETH
jgi:uncharacterized protein YndB with AHSA1/START domain